MQMNLVRRGALALGAVAIALGTAAFAERGFGGDAVDARLRKHMSNLKVALIAPSATNDLAFTQSMYSALESLKGSENLTISVSANEYVVSQAADIIQKYASEGYNLIVAHGSQYGSIIQSLAPKYPKVSFAWGTAGATFGMKNVFAYEASSNEGGYVQGYMAALLSKSKVLGICGPIATGDAKLYVDGFVAGAKAAAQARQVQGDGARRLHRLVQRRQPHGQLREDLRQRRPVPTCSRAARNRSSGRSASRSPTTSCGSARSGTRPRWRRATSSPRRSTTGSRSSRHMFTDIRGGTSGGRHLRDRARQRRREDLRSTPSTTSPPRSRLPARS